MRHSDGAASDSPADPVAEVLCPLATVPTEKDADVAALAMRADQAQKDVASQVFDPKYRAVSTAAFALQGAASGLASLNAQVPTAQRGASAAVEPFSRFRRGLEQAQQNLTAACGEF